MPVPIYKRCDGPISSEAAPLQAGTGRGLPRGAKIVLRGLLYFECEREGIHSKFHPARILLCFLDFVLRNSAHVRAACQPVRPPTWRSITSRPRGAVCCVRGFVPRELCLTFEIARFRSDRRLPSPVFTLWKDTVWIHLKHAQRQDPFEKCVGTERQCAKMVFDVTCSF